MARKMLLVLIALIVTTPVLKSRLAQATNASAMEETLAIQELQRTTPMSIAMIESARDVLAKGWSRMAPGERETFLLLFDPADSGELNDAYVDRVRLNYQKIRDAFDQEINFTYEPDSDHCIGERLYYADLSKLHICPYFLQETNTRRKARALIHEMAHLAFPALDRPYYAPDSAQYAALKPTAGRLAELPLVGLIVREILRQDTLFHPDAYAHFSVAVSGQPGALALYLGADSPAPGLTMAPGTGDQAGPDNGGVQLNGSSWNRRH